MKKIFFFVALALCSALSFGASITCDNIDFGTVSIKGQSSPMYGSTTVTVTWSGLATDGATMYAEISEGLLDGGTNPNGFYVSDPDYVYLGYGGSMLTSCTFDIGYGVKTAGTYSGKLHLYSYDTGWEEVHKYVNITITVTDDAIVAKTIPFERVETTDDLKDGDTIVFVCESAGAVCGPLDEPALTSVKENVKIDKSTKPYKAEVPEATAQLFRANKYEGNWQFVTADEAKKRLHLDIVSGKGNGAFTYKNTVAEQIFATWGVAILNGVAEVTRSNLDADYLYPVRWAAGGSGDRFKPYKSGDGETISIYKKAGKAQELQSSLTVDAVDFGEIEIGEEKEVTVNYTAENLTDDIEWEITGTDKALFSVTPTKSTDRTSGSVTVKYLGTAASVKTVSAKLYALTQNAALDLLDKEIPISITLKPNTIKLTKLAFSDAPTQIEQGQSIDMSKYLVFTPNDAEDKSLVWTTDYSYQGTVDANGVLTAKKVTGNVTVTATSVRVPSVSASATLQIVKPVVTDFTLSDSEVTLNIGGTKQLSVTAWVPDYASESATYASKNTTIATISKNGGLITAKALGETEITATIGEVVKTCKVKVVPVTVESIALPAEANLTLGSSLQLKPTISPAQAADEYTIGYESDNESVATVSGSGLVKGIAEGDAVITATISNKSAEITIHVHAAKTFAKVQAPGDVAEKDTIILATIYESNPIVAGARDGNKLTLASNGVSVNNSEAYADDACRLVLGKEKNKTGFTLTPVGSTKSIAAKAGDTGLLDGTTTNSHMWQFKADDNGVYVQNTDVSTAIFKYYASNSNIKFYSASGAVLVYAYVRKYVDPNPQTGMENVESSVSTQKIIRNGQILIIRNNEVYSVMGVKE